VVREVRESVCAHPRGPLDESDGDHHALAVVREVRVRACCGEGSKSEEVLW